MTNEAGCRADSPANVLSRAWAAGLAPESPFTELTGPASADVVIVGGGVAGVVTALNLALLGHRPILIEADDIASGATGASGGIVAPQIVRHGLDAVEAKLGREQAHRLFAMVAAAGHYVFDLARRHAPEAQAEQNGFLAPAMSQAGLAKLTASARRWEDFRDDVSIIDGDALSELSGLSGYAGALLDRSGGMINPIGYARGIARAAAEAGARIHVRSPVARLSRSGQDWIVETARGRVTARQVLLCANAGNAGLHPALRATVLPMNVCEVTTAPLSPELRAKILPQRHALTDIEDDVFTIRYDGAGGLVTAYPIGNAKLDPGRITQLVNARLSAAISGWQPLPLTHVWQGTASINTSLLPRLVKVDDGLIAVQACNGRGLAINSILGRDIARWLASPDSEQPPLPLEAPAQISGYVVARYAPRLIMAAGLLRKQVRQMLGGTR